MAALKSSREGLHFWLCVLHCTFVQLNMMYCTVLLAAMEPLSSLIFFSWPQSSGPFAFLKSSCSTIMWDAKIQMSTGHEKWETENSLYFAAIEWSSSFLQPRYDEFTLLDPTFAICFHSPCPAAAITIANFLSCCCSCSFKLHLNKKELISWSLFRAWRGNSGGEKAFPDQMFFWPNSC